MVFWSSGDLRSNGCRGGPKRAPQTVTQRGAAAPSPRPLAPDAAAWYNRNHCCWCGLRVVWLEGLPMRSPASVSPRSHRQLESAFSQTPFRAWSRAVPRPRRRLPTAIAGWTGRRTCWTGLLTGGTSLATGGTGPATGGTGVITGGTSPVTRGTGLVTGGTGVVTGGTGPVTRGTGLVTGGTGPLSGRRGAATTVEGAERQTDVHLEAVQ